MRGGAQGLKASLNDSAAAGGREQDALARGLQPGGGLGGPGAAAREARLRSDADGKHSRSERDYGRRPAPRT